MLTKTVHVGALHAECLITGKIWIAGILSHAITLQRGIKKTTVMLNVRTVICTEAESSLSMDRRLIKCMELVQPKRFEH
jgi:hypothetical protein